MGKDGKEGVFINVAQFSPWSQAAQRPCSSSSCRRNSRERAVDISVSEFSWENMSLSAVSFAKVGRRIRCGANVF